MKKVLPIVLSLLMLMTMFAGCSSEAEGDLVNAVDYITNMYQTAGKGEAIVLNTDKDVLATVTVDGVSYEVEWTVTVTDGAADAVKVSESDKANHVKLDLPDVAQTDIAFTATATVKDADGHTASVDISYKMNCTLGDVELVNKAYELADGKNIGGTTSLAGVITEIKQAWNAAAKNITVAIQIGDLTDKQIVCTELQGEGAEGLAVGDDICVSGMLANQGGVIGFQAGCKLVYVNKAVVEEPQPSTGNTEPTQPSNSGNNGSTAKPTTPTQPNNGGNNVPTDPKAIIDAAYKLEENTSLNYTATLTGKVVSIDDLYDAEYQNITVTIQVAGRENKPIKCYRMKGNGVDKIAKGDTITVTGTLKNHYGTVEFDLGCTMSKRVSGGGKVETVLTNPKDIVAAAFKLKSGEQMAYDVTLTGEVVSIDSPYSAEYDNITVDIKVEGKYIKCYRMKGNGIDKIKEGDTITVTGRIKNFNGVVEFDLGCSMTKRVAGSGSSNKTLSVVTAPVAGKAYKFGMVQGNVSATTVYYLKGGMSGYYMASASSSAMAIDVYLESTNGGYYLYTNYSGSKQYINMVVNGEHVNGAYESKASTVYTFDTASQTLIATVDGTPYWFGTRNDKQYTTIGPCKTEYEGFYCKLYQ